MNRVPRLWRSGMLRIGPPALPGWAYVWFPALRACGHLVGGCMPRFRRSGLSVSLETQPCQSWVVMKKQGRLGKTRDRRNNPQIRLRAVQR
jgi:hypothetical protein